MVEEVKLKVAYVMPPEPPSEIAEEHDGLERVLVPMQRTVDNGRSTSGLSSGSVSLKSAEVGIASVLCLIFLSLFFCMFLRKIIDDFHISFQEVGSPVGRIVKSEEFLKSAGPAMVCNICILFVLHFISCAMTHGY